MCECSLWIFSTLSIFHYWFSWFVLERFHALCMPVMLVNSHKPSSLKSARLIILYHTFWFQYNRLIQIYLEEWLLKWREEGAISNHTFCDVTGVGLTVRWIVSLRRRSWVWLMCLCTCVWFLLTCPILCLCFIHWKILVWKDVLMNRPSHILRHTGTCTCKLVHVHSMNIRRLGDKHAIAWLNDQCPNHATICVKRLYQL